VLGEGCPTVISSVVGVDQGDVLVKKILVTPCRPDRNVKVRADGGELAGRRVRPGCDAPESCEVAVRQKVQYLSDNNPCPVPAGAVGL
jgi:hypothetical protein